MNINKKQRKYATKRIYVGKNGNYFKHGKQNVGINIHIQNAPKQIVRKRRITRRPRQQVITYLHQAPPQDQLQQIMRAVYEFKSLFPQTASPPIKQNSESQTSPQYEHPLIELYDDKQVQQALEQQKLYEEEPSSDKNELEETFFQPTEVHRSLLEQEQEQESLSPPQEEEKTTPPQDIQEQEPEITMKQLRNGLNYRKQQLRKAKTEAQKSKYEKEIRLISNIIQKRQQGKGSSSQEKGTTVEDFINMILHGIKNIDDYDIVFVKDKTIKVPVLNHDNQIFIFFRKLPGSDCYHYSVGVYQKEYPAEVCLFDPLANEWVREQNLMFLARNITAISPEFMCKIKSNSNAWQDVSDRGFRKDDQSWCAEYCYLFLHHLLNLEQSYTEATEFNDKSDRPIMKRVLKFAEI